MLSALFSSSSIEEKCPIPEPKSELIQDIEPPFEEPDMLNPGGFLRELIHLERCINELLDAIPPGVLEQPDVKPRVEELLGVMAEVYGDDQSEDEEPIMVPNTTPRANGILSSTPSRTIHPAVASPAAHFNDVYRSPCPTLSTSRSRPVTLL